MMVALTVLVHLAEQKRPILVVKTASPISTEYAAISSPGETPPSRKQSDVSGKVLSSNSPASESTPTAFPHTICSGVSGVSKSGSSVRCSRSCESAPAAIAGRMSSTSSACIETNVQYSCLPGVSPPGVRSIEICWLAGNCATVMAPSTATYNATSAKGRALRREARSSRIKTALPPNWKEDFMKAKK